MTQNGIPNLTVSNEPISKPNFSSETAYISSKNDFFLKNNVLHLIHYKNNR